jgi:hypothetical protein
VDNGNGSSANILGTIAEASHAVALHLSGCHVSEFITLNLGGAIRPIRSCTNTAIGITQSTLSNNRLLIGYVSVPSIPNDS